MAAITQLTPSAIPGRRYGSFAGKTASSGGLDICRGVVTVTDNSYRTKIAANGYAVTVTDNSYRLDVCG